MLLDNKDYIINLRVSRAVYEKIKQKARENKESVSQVVRKAIDDSAEIIKDLSDEVLGKRDKFENIVEYRRSKAAKNIMCSKCGEIIPAGEIVTVGGTEGVKKYFFCKNCK